MISLCMIVRDEAALLPRFLESVEGLWDELCVADTGSQDESRSILAKAGAKITDFHWIDDFAAARNASLALATGDWIIYLDPDEFPNRELVQEIRQLDSDHRAGAATLLMRNLRQQNDIHEQRLLRLFRRDPNIRFEYPIHENAEKSIQLMLEQQQLEFRHLIGHVEHIGYQPALMQARNKRQRDQQILENSLATNPSDLYSSLKLLELANYWSETALAESTAQALLKQLAQLPPGQLLKHHWGGDLLARLARTLYPANPASAIELLQSQAIVPTLDYFETRGLFLEAAGQIAAANDDFSCALAICHSASHPRSMHAASTLGLCRLALANGEMEKARELADQAVSFNPHNTTSLRHDLLIAQLIGGEPSIRQRLHELGSRYGIKPELARLAPEFGLTATAVSGLAP